MSTEAEASTETITLPSEPEALAQAIVEHYPDAHDLNVIFNAMKAAIPGPLWIDLDADLVAQMGDYEAEMGSYEPVEPDPLPDPDAEPEGGWNDNVSKGLSPLQDAIMLNLWSRTQAWEHHHPPKSRDDVPRKCSWHPRHFYKDNTASERVAVSRALRHLESRGLVEMWRFAFNSGERFHVSAVSLTAEGRRYGRTFSYCEVGQWDSRGRLIL
jgi:hypothetical protein